MAHISPAQAKNIKATLKLWAERQIRRGNFPVIMISINEQNDVDIERAADYENWKLAKMLRYLADELEANRK